MREKAKREYEVLLNTGELLEMFPNMVGSWSKDKREFLKYQELNEQILKLDVDFELEEGDTDYYEE